MNTPAYSLFMYYFIGREESSFNDKYMAGSGNIDLIILIR